MSVFFNTLAYNAGYNHTLGLLGKMSVGRLVQKVKEKSGDEFFIWVFNVATTEQYINEPWYEKVKEYKNSKWTNYLEVEYVYEDLVPLEIAKAYINLRKGNI